MGVKVNKWMKLYSNDMDRTAFRRVRELGDTHLIMYMKIMCAAIETDGVIPDSGAGEDIYTDLAYSMREEGNVQAIRETFDKLMELGIIAESNGQYRFTDFNEFAGTETDKARKESAGRRRSRRGTGVDQLAGGCTEYDDVPF